MGNGLGVGGEEGTEEGAGVEVGSIEEIRAHPSGV